MASESSSIWLVNIEEFWSEAMHTGETTHKVWYYTRLNVLISLV
jgi:hypothetical protein